MGWQVWGDVLETADMSGVTKYCPIVMNDNLVLIAVRTWLIFYNNPALTSVSCKLYSNENNTPKKLIANSTNNQTKTALITSANGVIETWFDFDHITMRAGETYHFVLNATGYTGNAGSHMAWLKGWPDPVYDWGVTYNKLAIAPPQLYLIGADL